MRMSPKKIALISFVIAFVILGFTFVLIAIFNFPDLFIPALYTR